MNNFTTFTKLFMHDATFFSYSTLYNRDHKIKSNRANNQGINTVTRHPAINKTKWKIIIKNSTKRF